MLEKNSLYLSNLVDKCTNCGNCRIVCPAFKILGEEIYSTRGRINLIKGYLNDELNPTVELKDKIYICLNCRQCIGFCPADVDYNEIVTHTKARISTSNKILRFKNSLLKGIFSNNSSTAEIYFSLLRFFKKIIHKKSKLNFFGKLFYMIFAIDRSAKIPKIPAKNFFKMKIRHELVNDRGYRVALFLGCGGKYLYPHTSDNFVKILRSNGVEVLIPKDQVCCGNALTYKGLLKDSSRNMLVNSSSFNSLLDIKQAVSLCANATNLLIEYNSENSKPHFRLPVKGFIEFIVENSIKVIPKYDNSIVFHSCPKCGQADIYRNFVNDLYADYTKIPCFTGDFCGSTELMDKSNYDLRNSIAKSFFEENDLRSNSFIACSSFECVEHLNEFFLNNNLNIKAIHFIDALKTKN